MHDMLNILAMSLKKTRRVKVIEPSEMSDTFPMAANTVAGKHVVTQKCYIYLP